MKTHVLTFAVFSLLLVGAGCAPAAQSPTPSPAPTPAAQAPAPQPAAAAGTVSQTAVNISGFVYQPKTISVAAGTTVVWTNSDAMAHTVTADDGSFDSGTMATGATFSHTFTKAGSFSYHCALHPSMKASVNVQ